MFTNEIAHFKRLGVRGVSTAVSGQGRESFDSGFGD
jgi:hypothetical protein